MVKVAGLNGFEYSSFHFYHLAYSSQNCFSKFDKFSDQKGKIKSFCLFQTQDFLPTHKVEIFLEQREVAFLSPSKICENFAG